ncbi:membrane protein, putative [Minicystis rosea]|nr:membrane protein, putative [Minicystis rosea]
MSTSSRPSPAPAPPAGEGRSALARFFAFIVKKRWLIVALYALVLPPSAWFATKVGQDNDIQRLMVPTDPDFVATREFQKVFGAGEYALLIAEADDLFAPKVLERIDAIERSIAKIERVNVNSALSIFRRAKAGFTATPEQSEAFRKFVTGTELLKKQGLTGDKFIAIGFVLEVKGNADRTALLSAVDKAVEEAGGGGPPLRKLRRVGQPFVNANLDDATRAGGKYFALFTVFVVILTIALYRSVRTLIAFLITLGVCLATSVAYIGATGGTFTIVSPMVPMTILVTATATLVYIHSRFVDHPPGVSVEEHQIFALTNKFVACTASIFATLVGFAALAVSEIRPIRDMGIWVAVGLFLTWIVILTLFPALQTILRTPTSQNQAVAGEFFVRFTHWLPRASYRHRVALVASSLVMMAAGAVALFGLPGAVKPMQLLIDPVEYINHDSELYRDTKYAQQILPGLSMTEVWLQGKLGTVSEPKVLAGLAQFQAAVEADPEVGGVISPITILRITRYLGGQGDAFPTDADTLDQVAGDLEALVPREPMLQRFVDRSLGQTHFAIVTHATEHEAYMRLDARLKQRWQDAVEKHPALKELQVKTVGLGPLQAKMSQNLVPTLVESFVLTVAIIFMTFVVVFRSGAARLMTMIPSLFAILVMFGVMRLADIRLSVTTILIASTVLGTSENDQIHFFYHFLEKRKTGTVEEALRHTLLVSGKAIFFATLINACGFLAFAASDLPPVRQFGALMAVALFMSMLADFTALPAALWLVFRERPDSEKPAAPAPGE